MIRYDVVFKGRVQGVGFRYTAQDRARSLGLLGRVRNVSDGTVQLVVEGDESSIQELIRYLEVSFMIREKVANRSRALGGFEGFDITF